MINWPPCSLDYSPIENVCQIIKDQMLNAILSLPAMKRFERQLKKRVENYLTQGTWVSSTLTFYPQASDIDN